LDELIRRDDEDQEDQDDFNQASTQQHLNIPEGVTETEMLNPMMHESIIDLEKHYRENDTS
jgi:hypothetical protein